MDSLSSSSIQAFGSSSQHSASKVNSHETGPHIGLVEQICSCVACLFARPSEQGQEISAFLQELRQENQKLKQENQELWEYKQDLEQKMKTIEIEKQKFEEVNTLWKNRYNRKNKLYQDNEVEKKELEEQLEKVEKEKEKFAHSNKYLRNRYYRKLKKYEANEADIKEIRKILSFALTKWPSLVKDYKLARRESLMKEQQREEKTTTVSFSENSDLINSSAL